LTALQLPLYVRDAIAAVMNPRFVALLMSPDQHELHLAPLQLRETVAAFDGPPPAWLVDPHGPGSSEAAFAELPPGDYYLVADEAGIATRYALCIATGNTCAPGGTTQASR
jgi:hypothetical protein